MAHVQPRYEGSSRFPTQRLLPMARASQCDLRRSHTCRRRRCVSRVGCGWKRQRSTSITLYPMLDMFDSPAGRSPARVAACLITTHSPGKLRVRLSTTTFGCLGCKGQRSSWHVWDFSHPCCQAGKQASITHVTCQKSSSATMQTKRQRILCRCAVEERKVSYVRR